jgi:hypothetical protein
MDNQKKREIERLIDRAAASERSEDAMRFSQAACNAANALVAMSTARKAERDLTRLQPQEGEESV